MESDEIESTDRDHYATLENDPFLAPINSSVLEYYKKIGAKRDIEQHFSLSTAQSEVRDLSSKFWSRMKAQDDSSDAGKTNNEPAVVSFRNSIKCTVAEPSRSQGKEYLKCDSVSPPIITEEVQQDDSIQYDEESLKSEDNHSQKSADTTNKHLSPTSSISNQRKLEWDSLADVGYDNNENHLKSSSSRLSTLERLALKQQYSNDHKQDTSLGQPTAHSTLIENNPISRKGKKELYKKTKKITSENVEKVLLNIENSDANPTSGVNLCFTKHITLNVDNGELKLDNVTKNVSVTPEKPPKSSKNTKNDDPVSIEINEDKDMSPQNDINPLSCKIPFLVNINPLRKFKRPKKKYSAARKSLRVKKKCKVGKENIPFQEKSGNQVSDAESFEYMPGHIYNQNRRNEQSRSNNTAGNKSSLESSGPLTTDSSKLSKHSFTKDLNKGIELMKATLQDHLNDKNTRKKLVKDIVERLLKSNHRDDDTAINLLTAQSLRNKKLGLGDINYTTTSTSDANNTNDKSKLDRPRKSILRNDKLTANTVPLVSQSTPNLPLASNSVNEYNTNFNNIISSNTDSDKTSSGPGFSVDSSHQLYQRYLRASEQEKLYKKHLQEKKTFLKHKQVNSDFIPQIPSDAVANKKLKDLMKDLTRNNYNDGSGDAGKLEGELNFNIPSEQHISKSQRSHSVFTLSSESGNQCNKYCPKQKIHDDNKCDCTKTEFHYCCCPHHVKHTKVKVTDSSAQVNIQNNNNCCELPHQSSRNSNKKLIILHDSIEGDDNFVCLCKNKNKMNSKVYQCPNVAYQNMPIERELQSSSTKNYKCGQVMSPRIKKPDCSNNHNTGIKDSKLSQTDINFALLMERKTCRDNTDNFLLDSRKSKNKLKGFVKDFTDETSIIIINEAIRYTQTEISIDPKIPEPTFSDINIIPDCLCAQLVKEQARKYVPSQTKRIDSFTDISIQTTTNEKSKRDLTDTRSIDTSNVLVELANKSYQCNTSKSMTTNPPSPSDQFTIPIKGTNMTLMVSIGGKPPTTIENINNPINKETETDKQYCSEKATSLIEECSKAVQSSSKNMFTEIQLHQNIIESKHQSDKEKVLPSFKPCIVNTCCAGNKFNTYPKSVTINDKKLFRRSNTDLDCLKNSQPIILNAQKQRSNDTQSEHCKTQSTSVTLTNTKSTITSSSKKIIKPTTKSSSTETICDEHFNTKSCSDKKKMIDTEKHITPTNSKSLGTENCCPKSRIILSDSDEISSNELESDPIINLIQNITKRYTKKDMQKVKKKKCFKEIMSVLNYLLDTDESTDNDKNISYRDTAVAELSKIKDNINSCVIHCSIKDSVDNTTCDSLHSIDDCLNDKASNSNKMTDSKMESCDCAKNKNQISRKCRNNCNQTRKDLVDKGVQLSPRITEISKSSKTESSDIISDSATCKAIYRIKQQCEKYHQKRHCKTCHAEKKTETSSNTSTNCSACKKIHQCSCKSYKPKSHRPKCTVEKFKKRCVAYNLIIQSSESMISEETMYGHNERQLRNIIIKVPPKRKTDENVPFKEMTAKIEKKMSYCNPQPDVKCQRSRSWPHDSEISSTDEFTRIKQFNTMKDYLEKNRPDFIENSSKRQNCLKLINECRANERAAHRKLLSMQVEGERSSSLTAHSDSEIRRLFKEASRHTRSHKQKPKFLNERDMKKHSEIIYKSLPEVVNKKEEIKKDNIKKTNLLMASIFKKNLQKKTLRGNVNISNYNTIVKI